MTDTFWIGEPNNNHNSQSLTTRKLANELSSFIRRIATHILAFEGDSNCFYFEGNYADYEENRVARLGETSIKRIKYAPLVNA
jgi:hypothetical protein